VQKWLDALGATLIAAEKRLLAAMRRCSGAA
jgi:hypothetical protein